MLSWKFYSSDHQEAKKSLWIKNLRPCSHDAGMVWKRHHWPGTGMILLQIDKRSQDAGVKRILLTATSSEDWVQR